MSGIIQEHPIHSLLLKKSNKDDYIEMDDYHHFDNIRRYLEDLAKRFPNCTSRTGRKVPLKCSCCVVFRRPTVACAVANYLMYFGKLTKINKQLIIMEWIKSNLMPGDNQRICPYRLPYLPFSEYEDMLREEEIRSIDLPLDILHARNVCKTAMMNILGIGTKYWKTCENILAFGPKPSGKLGNDNANKNYMTETLNIFFLTIKELSEPVSTLVTRNKTGHITKMSLKNTEVGVHYLPPYLSKRRLYERYCFESGQMAKASNVGTYSFTERTDIEWVDDDDVKMDVLSWWKFRHQWKKDHGYLKIRKPAHDICQLCFRFSQLHKFRNKSNDDDDDDPYESDSDSDDTSDEDDDNNQYNDGMALGIIRQTDEVMQCREDNVMEAAEHVSDARNMREYANEKIALCKSTINEQRENKVLTLVCDFSQNGELPSFGNEQPGEVYYFSPLSIFIFGIVNTDEEIDKLTTYCYDEGVGKKGGNNVASLLMKHLSRTCELLSEHPMKELNIIMDNCAGQNKNKMVLRLAAYLVEANYFNTVNFIFYVVGHTKNPADRLFNLAKSNIRQQNVFTMKQFLKYMNGPYVTAYEVFEKDFKDYNSFLDSLYKDLTKPGVKKWQIFSVAKEVLGEPLTMIFKTSNRMEALSSKFGIKKTTTNRDGMLTAKIAQLDPPGRNDIKQVELYTKFRKFVPLIWQDECCPKPKDEILARFKIEKTEKVRVHKEIKKNEDKKRIEKMARNALTRALEHEQPSRAYATLVADNDDDEDGKKKRPRNEAQYF